MATVETVNIGSPEPNPYKERDSTGIGKQPQGGAVEVRPPGLKASGLGSGLLGDHIGDRVSHGGDAQAVYSFAREDLDRWQERLGRPLPNGSFGENLTTRGIDLTASRMGERWLVGGTVELQVTYPRLPCATFRGWMNEKGWLKTFTVDCRPGAYLSVVRAGSIRSGASIEVVFEPDHDMTIGLAFRALTTEPALLPRFLAAEESLDTSGWASPG